MRKMHLDALCWIELTACFGPTATESPMFTDASRRALCYVVALPRPNRGASPWIVPSTHLSR
jgi:hypothetical protein